MGTQAAGAVLNTVLRIGKAAAAAITQGIKRAIAKQTTEGLRVGIGVTWKICAITVLKKVSSHWTHLPFYGIIIQQTKDNDQEDRVESLAFPLWQGV